MGGSVLKLILTMLVAGLAFFAAQPGFAQNTSSVFGPTVKEGHSSAEYRAGIDVDDGAFAQRFHYQRALNGDLRWRVLVKTDKPDGEKLDFDYLQAELLWQLTPDGNRWQSGLRFDARYRDENRPEQFGFNWTNQITVAENWRARGLFLVVKQVGSSAGDGVRVASRWQAQRSLEVGGAVGVEVFNSYGSTADFPKLGDQRHQIGGYYSSRFAEDYSVFLGALFGMTAATPDAELRIWLGRYF
ncbi:MAG: hypothetical protein AAGC77_11465 [Pseudomonadota bacterium]